MAQYVFTNSWEKERTRLAGLESIWDPGTIRRLETLGVGAAWHCLEVGAGGGSIARWLCERVGTMGTVLATDIDPRFLTAIQRPNLEVLEHDAREALPGTRTFDLIHARMVVEHLGDDKHTAIKHMVDVLRPGGWLLLEDVDFSLGTGTTVTGNGDLIKRVIEACATVASSLGFAADYGCRLPADLIAAGLADVGAEGRSILVRGQSTATIFFAHTISVFRAAAVERGLVSDEIVDEVLQGFQDPTLRQMTPVVVAAWGRNGDAKRWSIVTARGEAEGAVSSALAHPKRRVPEEQERERRCRVHLEVREHPFVADPSAGVEPQHPSPERGGHDPERSGMPTGERRSGRLRGSSPRPSFQGQRVTTTGSDGGTRPTAPEERARLLADPGFGRVFTDHMVTIRWSAARGWDAAELRLYGPIELEPSSIALNYAQTVFDGLKVYRQPSGGVAAFRPAAHAERFRNSARRLGLPELPEEQFLEALHMLVVEDRDWVPAGAEHSLYVRPLMLATEPGLGVRPASEVLFLLTASPVGAYFGDGVTPVRVWVCEDYARAGPGGTGAAKCGGNYAAGLAGQLQAREHGCDDVVWLDAVERQWVEEMGGMNIFFVERWGPLARLVTPPLAGTILPGVIRDSLLALAPELGHAVKERRFSVGEWRRGTADGSITEVFACGTAAIITPIGQVRSAQAEWMVGDGEPGAITMQLRQALVDVQTGKAPDPRAWMLQICSG